MVEQNIPRTDWRRFCDQFTHTHRGWLVTINVLSSPAADGTSAGTDSATDIVHNIPLQTVAMVDDTRGISLVLCTGDQDRTQRVLVKQPVRMRLERTAEGADAALAIDTVDGRTARLAFRVAALPETANGLTEAEVRPG